MSGWRSVNLGEITELVTKGTTPPTVGEGFTEQVLTTSSLMLLGMRGESTSRYLHTLAQRCMTN